MPTNLTYVVAAYVVTFLVLAGYLVWMRRRQADLVDELAELERLNPAGPARNHTPAAESLAVPTRDSRV